MSSMQSTSANLHWFSPEVCKILVFLISLFAEKNMHFLETGSVASETQKDSRCQKNQRSGEENH